MSPFFYNGIGLRGLTFKLAEFSVCEVFKFMSGSVIFWYFMSLLKSLMPATAEFKARSILLVQMLQNH